MESNNMKAMREVVKELLDAMYDMGIDEETVSIAAESPNCHMHSVELLSVIKKAKTALSAPPRQCDVGTAEEQIERFNEFCDSEWRDGSSANCGNCPLWVSGTIGHNCQIRWAQMPYEEGGAK